MCKTAYEMVWEAAEKLKTMPKDEFIDLLERSGVAMREPKPTTKPVTTDDYISNFKNDKSERLKKELIRRMESGCEERQACPHCKMVI